MKAVRFHEYGAPHVLKLEDAPLPTLRDTDVLVRVHSAGVNPIDWKVRADQFRGMIHHDLPLIPGWDFSGVIEELGAKATGAKIGSLVFGKADIARDGAYAEYLAVDVANIADRPSSLDHVNAAAVPTAGLTAWQALDGLRLARGQSLLIQGAAGGVGSFAVQFAKARGLKVLATAQGRNRRHLEKLGADVVIDYESERFEDRANGVDAVLDLVGGDVEERSFAVVRPGGAFASTVRPPSEESARRHDVRAVAVGARMVKTDLEAIARLIDGGVITVPLTEVMPLADARRAHEILESHHARGKIVLRIV